MPPPFSALKRALKGTAAKTRFIDERKLRIGALLARLLGQTRAGKRIAGQVAFGEALFAMNRGIPNGRFLAGAYWKRRGGLPADFPRHANPARDNCGMLWVSPTLPSRGADVLALHALVEPVYKQHGIDLFVTFSMINERALGAVITVCYDKQDEADVARARACYGAVFALCMAHGYIPYRVGNQSMAALDPHADVDWQTVTRIKDALDPQGLLAPGRSQPASAAKTERS